ncbi:hypothetical protein GCM10009815_05860 [Nocardioides marmoribigeumensis]
MKVKVAAGSLLMVPIMPVRARPIGLRQWRANLQTSRGVTMGKTGRKRRARKKKGANHGKRPNA